MPSQYSLILRHSERSTRMFLKLIFSRNAASNLENENASMASNRNHQSALRKASHARAKSIFVEIYQKQRTVMAIFSNSLSSLLSVDSFLAGKTTPSGSIP